MDAILPDILAAILKFVYNKLHSLLTMLTCYLHVYSDIFTDKECHGSISNSEKLKQNYFGSILHSIFEFCLNLKR